MNKFETIKHRKLMDEVYKSAKLQDETDLWAAHFHSDGDQISYSTYRHNNHLRRHLETKIWRLFVKPGDYVLDVGCGTGFFLDRLGKEINALRLAGIDVSFNAINLARARVFQGLFQVADAENLPFADEVFDVVMAYSVFQYMICPDRAIEEIFRVLKPAGRMIWTIHRPAIDFFILPSLLRSVIRMAEKLTGKEKIQSAYGRPISEVRRLVFETTNRQPWHWLSHFHIGTHVEFMLLRKLGFSREILFHLADRLLSLPVQYCKDLELFVCQKPGFSSS